MKALIFAAGLGTRLKPLTDTLPKALVPVDGKPLLWHNIQRLKSFGVDDLIINVHHFANQIEEYVHSQDDFGIRIRFSDERSLLLDTGGGLLHAEPLLLDGGIDEPFIVHNVDVLTNLDLNSMMHSFPNGAMAMLSVSSRPSSRRLVFDENMRLCGWMNLATGSIKGQAAVGDKFHSYAFSGIHLISPSVFQAFDSVPQFQGPFGIVDFYLAVCRQYPIFGYCMDGFRMLDVGKVDALASAAGFLKGII